jgi:hypothetical protein
MCSSPRRTTESARRDGTAHHACTVFYVDLSDSVCEQDVLRQHHTYFTHLKVGVTALSR